MNFYFEAAKALDRLDAKQGSIKSIIGSFPEKNRKRTAALVIETLKYKPVLVDIIHASKLLREEKKVTSLNLALVLIHDTLLSDGGIQAGDGPIKQAILRHKTRLHSELQKIKVKRGARLNQELANMGDPRAAQIPRYVRVNTLVWTTEEAIQSFLSCGFELSGPFNSSKGFAKDIHIPDLLLFSPTVQFHDDPLFKSGKVIIQDKASCFPAIVLAPPPSKDAVVIDATAAPGNKTSHLSALMHNKGKLFAFERDQRRFHTLKMMLAKAQSRNTETINADFLTVDPQDPKFTAVTHILLDPSCSGSGIVNRLDHLLEPDEENATEQEERLARLASFQLMMILHAMKFPSVQRIVYSTCSIHATENEHVVREALKSGQAQIGHFQLAPQKDVLPGWPRRGLPVNDIDASSLIRCSPEEDQTNGFFVSCFTRNQEQFPDVGTAPKRSPEGPSTTFKDARRKKKRKMKKE